MLKGRATALHPLRAHLHIHVRIPLSQTRIVDYDGSESEVSDLLSRQEHGNEPTMMRPYMLCVVGQPEDEVLDRHGAQHAPPTLMVACGEEIEVACSCREARGLGRRHVRAGAVAQRPREAAA